MQWRGGELGVTALLIVVVAQLAQSLVVKPYRYPERDRTEKLALIEERLSAPARPQTRWRHPYRRWPTSTLRPQRYTGSSVGFATNYEDRFRNIAQPRRQTGMWSYRSRPYRPSAPFRRPKMTQGQKTRFPYSHNSVLDKGYTKETSCSRFKCSASPCCSGTCVRVFTMRMCILMPRT